MNGIYLHKKRRKRKGLVSYSQEMRKLKMRIGLFSPISIFRIVRTYFSFSFHSLPFFNLITKKRDKNNPN